MSKGFSNKKLAGNAPRRNKQAPIKSGTYPARVVQIFVLGLQPQQFRGQAKPSAVELHITYEILNKFVIDEDGNENKDKPRWLSETFPLHSRNSDLAKSTKRYNALDPDYEHKEEWDKLIGTPCMIQVEAKPSKKDPEIVYNNVVGVSAFPDGFPAPELKNEPKLFSCYSDDVETFLTLPEWLQEKIKEAEDFEGGELEAALASGPKDSKEEPEEEPEEEEEEVEEKSKRVRKKKNEDYKVEENKDEIPW